MNSIWFYLYNLLAVPLLILAARLAAPFNQKLRDGFRGRTGIFDNLHRSFLELESARPHLWFHVSSLGEFEQAKPIIQTVKNTVPEVTVIVTFFSPSGYRHSINYKFADVISYLPLDTRRQARRFIERIRPDVAVFIRYDVWPNHVWTLAEKGIPFYLSSATMREKSIRLSPLLRTFHRQLFNQFTAVLTVTDSDARQFKRFGLTEPVIECVGDTRYDQVLQRSAAAQEIELLPEGFTRRKKVLVIGSSWLADEEHLIPAVHKLSESERSLLTILVPHEPTEQNLDRIEKHLGRTLSHIRFSHINHYNGEKIVIVDSVGILSTLYKYAHVAYIGGGFKAGVHNVLEAAVYGIPVVFGPQYTGSHEAAELIKRKGGFVVADTAAMYAIFQRLFADTQFRKQAGSVCRRLVQENSGATERILKHLLKHLK
jgi:3-deoxy-D-manno-octulosonic-acid transferase